MIVFDEYGDPEKTKAWMEKRSLEPGFRAYVITEKMAGFMLKKLQLRTQTRKDRGPLEWRKRTQAEMLDFLKDEAHELAAEIHRHDIDTQARYSRIFWESIDVLNVAMMIADLALIGLDGEEWDRGDSLGLSNLQDAE